MEKRHCQIVSHEAQHVRMCRQVKRTLFVQQTQRNSLSATLFRSFIFLAHETFHHCERRFLIGNVEANTDHCDTRFNGHRENEVVD